MKVEIYDPPMCCSTGVCGPSVDPKLVSFAADLDWLKRQGVEVERFNLSQQPAAFVANPVVKEFLTREGNDCLPLILVDGGVVHKGGYPGRETLAGFVGIEVQPTLYTDAVRELVAIGAAIASNCGPCFKHHYHEARKLGVTKDDIRLAVETAQAVKESPARSVLELAEKFLESSKPRPSSSCCGGGDSKPSGGKCCG